MPEESLFASDSAVTEPLAAAMRPKTLNEFFGQGHLLGPDKPLRLAIEQGRLHSLILWGPPGVGKTTLARIAAQAGGARFIQLSAVLAGVKEIREAVQEAKATLSIGQQTVLFVDEVHRFNKSQQDAFLPHVEDGTFIFIGATTENPSFELNAALLSRARLYRLQPLETEALVALMQRAVDAMVSGVQVGPGVLETLAHMADGDGRRALSHLELAGEIARALGRSSIDDRVLEELNRSSLRRFDKGGDQFYEQISALHKAVRGSDPDASLYWFARLLDGGCDPLYLARRLVRIASEDIGNADPRGLEIALNAYSAQERLGSPEGELALAQAVIYLACAAKSNAVYKAFQAAKVSVDDHGSLEVPMHLRNAPTQLMKDAGFGEQYRYAHDEPYGYAAGENYWPQAMAAQQFYHPVDRGLEIKITEKLLQLRNLDKAALSAKPADGRNSK